MKNFLWLAVFILSTNTVFAETRWGSECGLTDQKDDSWVEVGKGLNLQKLTKAEIRNLPTLTKQQLIIMAKEFAKGSEDNVPINCAIEAVDYLKGTDDGPYISTYLVRGKKYTEVLIYPGDNPIGVIFKQGTVSIVADNGDDSIACR
ncbi:MAG: hypothetical protein ABIQ95_13940 [Bdellovibrionia bacterium]